MPAWLPAVLWKKTVDKDRSPKPAVLWRRRSLRADRPVVHVYRAQRRSNLGGCAAHQYHPFIRHSFHRAVLARRRKNHSDRADRRSAASCRNRLHYGAIAGRWFPRKLDDAVVNASNDLSQSAGLNFGSVTPWPVSSKTTCTGIPI